VKQSTNSNSKFNRNQNQNQNQIQILKIDIYFRYTTSPVSCDAPTFAATCSDRIKEYALDGYSTLKNLTVAGISKDDRIIYAPYDSNGEIITDLDVCNGKLMDNEGTYAYFMTDYFPYSSGKILRAIVKDCIRYLPNRSR